MTAPPAHDVELAVGGMTCAACARRVERALERLDGVSARVNPATARATVLAEEPRPALAEAHRPTPAPGALHLAQHVDEHQDQQQRRRHLQQQLREETRLRGRPAFDADVGLAEVAD